MPDELIPSLAVIKANFDRRHDYVENFVPFTADCLRRAESPVVVAPEIRACVEAHFGIRIPLRAIAAILARCERHGYVTRKFDIYYPDADKLEGLTFSVDRAEVLRSYALVLTQLRTFARERFQQNWTEESADAAFVAYLREGTAPVLMAAVDGQPIPAPAETVRGAHLIVNEFALAAYENDPPLFGFLETVMKGSMLATALYFPDLSKVDGRLQGVDVYFDTKFLLRAIGASGPVMQEATREVMDLVFELGGNLRCFEHTRDEIRGVMASQIERFLTADGLAEAYGETLDYFASKGGGASDLSLLLSRLDRFRRSLGPSRSTSCRRYSSCSRSPEW